MSRQILKDPPFRRAILTNVIVVVISVGLTLLSMNLHVPQWFFWGFLLLMCGVAVGVFIYEQAMLFQSENNRLLETREADSLEDCVPTFLQIMKREDVLTLDSSGSGRLDCSLELEWKSEHRLAGHFCLPFYIDVEPTVFATAEKIRLVSIVIDEIPLSTHGVYERLETRQPVAANKKCVVEAGVIKIPVPLTRSRRRSKINLSVLFEDGFRDLFSCHQSDPPESYGVDIPYVTRSARATINAPPGCTFTRYTFDSFVEAVSNINGTNRDPDESAIQCEERHFSFSETQLVWETKCAKLGYRYKLHFGCRNGGGSAR